MEKFKIVADSSADLLTIEGVPFSSAPLRIITSQKEYVDDINLDVDNMVVELSHNKDKSSTSCPNPEDWLNAFGEAENIFCVTITNALSGSYNAAMAAKAIYEERHIGRRVFVINSLSAGPELKLIAEKLAEMIKNSEDYDSICSKIMEYKKHTGLVFMLESMKMLANNGRVSHLVAKTAGILGIRLVSEANSKGELQPLERCRGVEKTLAAMVRRMKELGLKSGKVLIAHCYNEEAANKLKAMLNAELSKVKIEIYKCRGLCSYYAEKGGLLVGYEKY